MDGLVRLDLCVRVGEGAEVGCEVLVYAVRSERCVWVCGFMVYQRLRQCSMKELRWGGVEGQNL